MVLDDQHILRVEDVASMCLVHTLSTMCNSILKCKESPYVAKFRFLTPMMPQLTYTRTSIDVNLEG